MKRNIAVILCLFLFLTACAGNRSGSLTTVGKELSAVKAVPAGLSDAGAPEGYTAVAENTSYRLFADLKTGDFAVWDIANEQITYSGQHEVLDPENPISELNFGRVKTDLVSLVAIQYVQISTIASTAVPFYQNSYAYCVIKNQVKVETVENGYRASFTFGDIGATVPVEITLHESGITARVVGEAITTDDDYRITSISLLPGFMAGYERDDGYLFIPSGSGALIPLSSGRGDSADYHEMVYGADKAIGLEEYEGETQQIAVPVYGFKDGNRAIFAVITAGDASAQIEAVANSSSTCFTRVFSDYVTAVIDSTTLFESNFENQRVIYGVEERQSYGDYEVAYHFLSGEDADWVGMAKLYRQKLALKQNAEEPTLMLTLYGAARRKASFLGIPYQKRISLTTFAEAKQILTDLYESGVPATLRYIGWNGNGIQNESLPVSFSPCSVLGGKSGYRSLTDGLSSMQTDAYFDVNLMTFRRSGGGFSVYSDVCKSIFHTRVPVYQFMRSTYVPVNDENPSYLLTPGNVVSAIEKVLKSTKTDGISSGDLGGTLYSDFSAGSGREETLAAFTKIFAEAAKNHALAFDSANAYVFPYATKISSIPMTSDGNLLFCEDVPFLQMLLHGHLSYAAESAADLFDCIAYGADPQFIAIAADDSELMETAYNWLYGTDYESRAEEIKQTFKQYRDIYNSLYDAEITDYRRDGDLSKTVFATGEAVYVNRGESTREWNGVTLEPGVTVRKGGSS
ncbi:MAG: hypothetical protein IJT66_04860 [Clostridia bacterium]|nr:hypothetical protein [Clostridia bacterium]